MSFQSSTASSDGRQPGPDPASTNFPSDRKGPLLGEFSQLINSARSVFDIGTDIDVANHPELKGHSLSGSTSDRNLQATIEEPFARLGDFHRVRDSIQACHKPSTDSHWQLESAFEELAVQGPDAIPLLANPHSHSPSLPGRIRRGRALSRPKWPSETRFQPPNLSDYVAADTSTPELDPTSESDQGSESRRSAVTPVSTPPTPQPQFPFSESRKRAPKNELRSPKVRKLHKESKEDDESVLFSYFIGKGCLPIPVYGPVLCRAERHLALDLRLGSLHEAVDTTIAQQFPCVASNGTHVFIDMSNIEINFVQALKAKHSLSDDAYPVPQRTRLDLALLTRILVRGRAAISKSVSCSVVPGRSQPWYVSEFKQLDYHVDLRQRKPVQDSSSTPLCIRYVEDLVDETLQTRIAEAVMEYFDRQGTIILATGDAKPAEYSDGFFTYVERALRMGWNVELASWKSSLSSTWTSRRWKAQWGNKFRVIQLDNFLDLLLDSEI